MMRDDGAVSQRGSSDPSPYVIGLTGPIASGKSTVAEMLRQRGAEVIDADRVYRSLLVPGSRLWRRVVERFGPAVIGPDGEIDRRALADVVFADPDALADLDRITHPPVVAEIRSRIARSSAPIVVIEAVKLVQSGLASDVDALWLVTADSETRLRRLLSRTGMDDASARARIAAATDTVPEGVNVGATIDNSGDLASLSSDIDDAWRAVSSGATRDAEAFVTKAEGALVSERVTVDVYFDFACPYVHSAAAWLREANRQLGDSRIEVTWKFFPLEQVNAPADADTPIWHLPAERRSRGRDSFHAAAAARRQGPEAFELFHAALLTLKHEEGEDHGKRSTLDEAASRAQLDLTRFAADLDDRSLLKEIENDYVSGREELGVFGTPTFVFPNGQSAYLRILPPPPAEEAVAFWLDFVRDVRDRPYLREIKRPQRPQ